LDTDLLSAGFRATYIEIPVLVSVRLGSNSGFAPKLFVGPSLAFRLSAKATGSAGGVGVDEDVKEFTNATDFGIVGGIGADVGKLSFDARYTLGLTQFASENDAPDLKWTQIGVYVGFVF